MLPTFVMYLELVLSANKHSCTFLGAWDVQVQECMNKQYSGSDVQAVSVAHDV